MYTKKAIVRGALLTSFLAAVVACGGGGSSSSSSDSSDSASVDQAYAGPGSKWDVTLNDDDSFVITRREAANTPVTLTVEGTYDRLASGFVKLTVSSSEGDDGPSQGDEAWALEVPGYAFFLNPIQEESSQMIAMVESGECPTEDFTGNWVLVKKSDEASADDDSRDFFGTFAFDAASGEGSLPEQRSLENTTVNLGPQASLGTGTCSDGIMIVGDEGDQAAMYLTNNGGAIVQTNISDENDASFVFALGQKQISAVANLDGEYSGILFDSSQSNGEEISPVSFSCASGTCTGNIVTNIDTGEVSVEEVTVSLSGTADDIADGLITGTIDNGGDTGTLACLADVDAVDSGKKVISCVGQSPGDNANMFNVMLVTK